MVSSDHGPRALRLSFAVLLVGIMVIGVYSTDNSGFATTETITELHGGEAESHMAEMEQPATGKSKLLTRRAGGGKSIWFLVSSVGFVASLARPHEFHMAGADCLVLILVMCISWGQ